MKEFFAGKNRIADGLDAAGRKERRGYIILTVVLFVLGAFSFWEFIYELCHMIGSIVSGDPGYAVKELIRMMPLILTAFIYVYIQVYVYNAYTAINIKKRAGAWRVNGRVTVFLGAAVSAYVITGVIAGEYAGFIEGYISPLFPLDICVGGILFMGFGIGAVRYSRRLEKDGSRLPFGVCRRHGRAFTVLSYTTALGAFAACVYSVWVMDWSHGYLFFNIMLWLSYFTSFAQAFVYRFVYTELKRELRAPAMKKLGAAFLIANIAVFVLYLLSIQLQNEAPNQNAFGLLPVEFTASFNAFPVLYFTNGILAPLYAILKGLVTGRKK